MMLAPDWSVVDSARFTAPPFIANHPIVLASLLAYQLAGPASLKAWLAVQSLPDPVLPDAPLRQDSHRRLRKALGLVACLALFSAEYYAIATASTSAIDVIASVMAAACVQVSLMVALGDVVDAGKWVVHRASTGALVWRFPAPSSFSPWRAVPITVLSLAANYGAYAFREPYLCVLVGGALVYRFTSRSPAPVVSLRGIVVGLLVWIFSTLILSALLVVALLQAANGDAAEVNSAMEGVLDTTSSLHVVNYLLMLVPVLWACAPGLLITACYRFDYHLYTLSSPDLAAQVASSITRVDPPTPSRCGRHRRLLGPLTPGSVVPSSLPAFARPYSTTAFFALALVQATLALTYALVPLPAYFYDNSTFELICVFVEIPVVVAAVVACAVVRREGRAFWTYREEWAARPAVKGAIRLAADDDDDDTVVDEKAPLLVDVAVAVPVDGKVDVLIEA